MKDVRKVKILAIVFLCILFNKIAQGDVIPPNSHFVIKCVKITNIDDYNNVALLGYILWVGWEHLNTYQISSTECLQKGYKFNVLKIYATTEEYIKDKNISNINLPNDLNALKANIVIEPYGYYVYDSIPLLAIDQFYKIAGFTDSTVVLYKWKEIIKYNNGTPDSVQIFDYKGDLSSLSQQIPTHILNNNKDQYISSKLIIFPNPVGAYLNIQIGNNYYGKVKIDMLTVNGRIFNSFLFYKTDGINSFLVPTNNLRKGIYFLRIMFGDMVETKKVIIK